LPSPLAAAYINPSVAVSLPHLSAMNAITSTHRHEQQQHEQQFRRQELLPSPLPMQPTFNYLSASQSPLPPPLAAAQTHPSVAVSLPPLNAIETIAPMHQSQHEQQHRQDQQYYHQQYQLPSPSPSSAHSQPPQSPHVVVTMYPQIVGIPYPQNTRIMSGGRHQKEIRRRTKTGCKTCRNRRIKVRFHF
jgi:hypothetical protein